MGCSSQKPKKNANIVVIIQPKIIQPIQDKSQEFKIEQQNYHYHYTRPKITTQNQNTYNNCVAEPPKNLLICNTTQQNKNLIDFNPSQFNQNSCENFRQNLPKPSSNLECFYQDKNCCIVENNNINSGIDEQKINSQLLNDQYRVMEPCKLLNNGYQYQRIILNQRLQQIQKLPFKANNNMQMNKFNNRKQLGPQCNNFNYNQKSEQLAQKPVNFNKPENNQQFTTSCQQQQIENQETGEQIEIYNKIFKNQTQGQFSNNFPCKHSKCKTVAHLNIKGDVTCDNGCTSYPINESIFNNKKNTISCFNKNKQYDFNNYKQIKDEKEFAQIIQDSLICSNKTQSESENLLCKFINVMFTQFTLRKHKNKQ